MLDVIESRNLFLLSLDENRTWYRYHHLFSEFLRGRLERDYPGTAASLYAKAARWFEQCGYLSDALEHATDARDNIFLGRILERSATPIACFSPDALVSLCCMAVVCPY